MDNRQIDIKAEGRLDFDLAMKLSVTRHKTVGYRVHENKLVLYWCKSEKMQPFPYEMTVDQVTAFAWGWLEANKPSRGEPDHDGDNGKGFHVYNESWGHVLGEYEAFIAIEPIWAMYGK